MKTKRNKKQKNRSFRKNRSFKKKGVKKNPTRKNVGGHLMGFEVGATAPFNQPRDHFLGGERKGINFCFTAHSFKHIDTFEGETYEHDSIEYPICEADIKTNNVMKCTLQTIDVKQGNNLVLYNTLAQKMFRYMSQFLDMDTVVNWFHDATNVISEKTKTIPGNIPKVDNKPGFAPNQRKWVEVNIPDGRKIHLSMEKITPAGAHPYLLFWEFSQKYITSAANSETGYFTGNEIVYPSAKFNLSVNNATSVNPIDIVIGTLMDINVEILNTVRSSDHPRGLSFGNVQIYNTTNGVISAPQVLPPRDVTNTNQIINYTVNDPAVTALRIVANIKTYYNQITRKIQDINIIPVPPPPPPNNLTGFTFGDATIIANSLNKNVVGTRVAADNGIRILIEKWRIGIKEDKLGEYRLEAADPSINIEIDPTKPIELRAYAINAANVKSNGYEARDYEFDYIKSADVVKAVQGISTFTSTAENPITHVVNGDIITMRVNYKIINKRLLFFYCYTAEENNRIYVFDRLIENGQSTLDFQIDNRNINNRFVKFLFYMKEGAGDDTTGINREDLSSYKELIIPLLSADARGENESDVKCVISGNTQNAISAQLKQNGEEKGNQLITEKQTYRFPGLNRGLGDAQNSYFVTVNGNNERKIILPVSCNALEGEAAQTAEKEETRMAEEAKAADAAKRTATTRLEEEARTAEVTRLDTVCKTYKIGDVQIFKSANIKSMNKKIQSMEPKNLIKLRDIIGKTVIHDDDCEFIFQELFKDLRVSSLTFKGLAQEIKIDIVKCIKHKLTIPDAP
jgi:hypothetical protein